METENKTSYVVPAAIVLAGVIIAGTLYFKNTNQTFTQTQADFTQTSISPLDQIIPVSAADHLRGNPQAPVIIVEYSDTECPFCSIFHNTMRELMAEYGKTGQVAWVYRSFPVDELHAKSRAEAVALECAAELGGNGKFWAYTDRIYEITPGNDSLDPAELFKIAEYVGLDKALFTACLTSGKYDDRIQANVQNAKITGAEGTPWSIVLNRNGDKMTISGAKSYAEVKQVIDNLLAP